MVRVVFLHPDLGIGGAERAMVDAALALRSHGHSVHFVTSHHDPGHCFPETRDGRLDVTTVGDWLPRGLFGRCQALCAYVRMLYAALYLVALSGIACDVVVCDQVAACIPVLRGLSSVRVLFYCHFPDLLLTQRDGLLKRLYRAPLDWIEEVTTGMAHRVLVNSKFTAGIFAETFKSLDRITPEVLYPIPDFSLFEQPIEPPTEDLMPSGVSIVFLSINRYERKKHLALAIKALAVLEEREGVHLVMAGGYDDRVSENKEHYLELKALVEELHLQDHVSFLRSVSDSQKRTLLRHSTCLLYTPDREHFGIVPIEAMYMKCPVIAVGSGGPLETVADTRTGFLCSPDAASFAAAMNKFVEDGELASRMGAAAHEHVISKFSFQVFSAQLHRIITDLCS